MFQNSLCGVPGIRVGHAHDENALTGCTVIIPSEAAVAGVDVRGSAPGTREIELLYPTRLVSRINAILLSGGSAFGLDAAGGVQQFLEERNIGYDTGVAKVPIVPAAVIFDLSVGDPKIRPDKQMGYQAAQNANESDDAQGSVGAGIGATVGKFAGFQCAMKGGLGSCSTAIGNGVFIGALAVVNALGNIIDPETQKIVAGAINPGDGSFVDPVAFLMQTSCHTFPPCTNTTLGVIVTNADMTKDEMMKIAQMANDGLARAIYPAHTQYDGDIVFAMATGTGPKADAFLLGTLSADLMARAIVRGVRAANK